MRVEIAYNLKMHNATLEELYDRNWDQVQRYIGNFNIDELKKFLGYLPKLELDVHI